jgi:spore coat polysaccharide biosynthesis protein SpsF (cytidylyltransferase family)
LTLDEAADYELLEKVYSGVEYDNILTVREAITYIDKHGLKEINAEVEQKKVSDASDNSS